LKRPFTEKLAFSNPLAHYFLLPLLSPKNGWTITFKKSKINKTMAKKVSVTPLHDRVIVKPAAAEEKTAGGIIIPDTAKEKPQRGIVIAAGPGKKDEPVTVKNGDTVLYGKYAGTEIQIEGVDYLIMRESDILAIV
jgi:chaperonin GroES